MAVWATAQAVADFLGRGDDTELVALAGQHLPIVQELVRTHTRGVGFEGDTPNYALAAVIVSATARLSSNPDSTITVSVDDFSIRKTVFEGFSLVELAVLDAFRRKAA